MAADGNHATAETTPGSGAVTGQTDSGKVGLFDSKAWLNHTPRLTTMFLLLVASVIVFKALDLRPRVWWRMVFPATGQIYVDSPEVYTRERLINERLREDKWLNDQLKEVDDERSLAGVIRQIRTLAKIGDDNASSAQTDVKAHSAGDNAKVQKADDTTQSDRSASDGADAPEPGILTFDQKLRIKSANRDLIMQRIIENRLDDRHDLNGNSLYILKFDTTVIANDLSSNKAIVKITIVPPIFLPPNGIGKDASGKNKDGEKKESGEKDDSVYDGLVTGYGYLLNDASLEVMRRAWTEMTESIATSLNNRITNEYSKVALPDFSPSQAIKNAVSKEFGIIPEEIGLIQDRTGNSNRLLIAGLNEYLTLTTADAIGLKSDPPTFFTDEQSTSFYLAYPKHCENKNLKTATAGPGFSSVSLSLGRQGRRLFEGSHESAEAQFYRQSNSFLIPDRELFDLTTALIENDKYRLKIASQMFRPWGILSRDTQTPGCEIYSGSIYIGFANFVRRISSYNTYSYSVLPRQSVVSIINEVVRSSSINLLADENTSFLSKLLVSNWQRDFGSSLESRVSSFGNIVEASSDNPDSANQAVVGWIIDPRAGSIAQPRDSLASATESALAIVSVPAWWPSIKLRVERGWIDDSGTYVPIDCDNPKGAHATVQVMGKPDQSKGQKECGRMTTVDLPNTQQLIEGSLLAGDRRTPRIDDVDYDDSIEQTDKEKVTNFLVKGKRLWRNTTVTIGTVSHTSLTVLPNMEGIIAGFNFDKIPCNKKLRVWTSEGVDEFDPDIQFAGCTR